MKIIERLCRFFLAGWFLICVIDGWGYLLFDVYLTGEPGNLHFLAVLMKTKWFWWTLKIVQTYCVISLLINYRSALALLMLTPSSITISLFYFFELKPFAIVGGMIIVSSLILFKAYWPCYSGVFSRVALKHSDSNNSTKTVGTTEAA